VNLLFPAFFLAAEDAESLLRAGNQNAAGLELNWTRGGQSCAAAAGCDDVLGSQAGKGCRVLTPLSRCYLESS